MKAIMTSALLTLLTLTLAAGYVNAQQASTSTEPTGTTTIIFPNGRIFEYDTDVNVFVSDNDQLYTLEILKPLDEPLGLDDLVKFSPQWCALYQGVNDVGVPTFANIEWQRSCDTDGDGTYNFCADYVVGFSEADDEAYSLACPQ